MKYTNVVYFDVETTGLKSSEEYIIEFACKNHDKKTNKAVEIDDLVMPKKEISPKITEITGITNEMVKEKGISQVELAEKMAKLFTEDCLVVAHNALFDIQFIERTIRREIDENYKFKGDVIDTLTIAKDRFDYPHKLIDCTKHYKIDFVPTHRALDDIIAMIKLIGKLKEEKDDLDKYTNIVGYYPKYGKPKVDYPQLDLRPQNGWDIIKPLYEM